MRGAASRGATTLATPKNLLGAMVARRGEAAWGFALWRLENYLLRNHQEVEILRINELLDGVPAPERSVHARA